MDVIGGAKSEFQSLLCWILYYDLICSMPSELNSGRFNPYYVGYCTMT